MEKELYCNCCDDFVSFKVIKKEEVYKVKDKEITITSNIPFCNICGEELYCEELEEENLERAYRIYREEEGILSSEEIKAIREMYGLSQRSFSKILKWGEITINRYEMGAIPDKAHNNTLILLKDYRNMETILNNNIGLLPKSKEQKLRERIKSIKSENEFNILKNDVLGLLYDKDDITTGFKKFDFDSFKNLVAFFVKNIEGKLYKTKLMKLLWYSDFKYFKENTKSITGLQYARLPRGPVVENREFLIGLLEKDSLISLIEDINTGGEYFKLNDENIEIELSEEEIEIANSVLNKFNSFTAKDISDYSHGEEAWIENKMGGIISYEFANKLREF